MPRIDPLQLLKCLSVLLTPEGGILSKDEVPRLVNLMTKFSKKLVSKCVYVLILKNTSTELVDMFMGEGGWTLIQTWLQDAVQTGNWHLVKEILGLLLITPVDVERLKLNILPKLIKSLSRRDDLEDVSELSTQLVKHWLVIVKGSSGLGQTNTNNEKSELEVPEEEEEEQTKILEKQDIKENNIDDSITTKTFYNKKINNDENHTDSMKDNNSIEVIKVKSKDDDNKIKSSPSKTLTKDKDSRSKDRHRDKDRRSSTTSNSSRSKSSRDKDRRDRDKDKDRRDNKDRKKTSSSSSSSRDKDKRYNGTSKSSSSNKDKKESSSSSKSKSSSSSSDLPKSPSIDKLGRIPKKSSSSSTSAAITTETNTNSDNNKKKSFSVGIRKDSEDRPKTVKIYNSKMRSTGLEEEAKPAPSRPVKKTTSVTPLPTIPPLKRSSPPPPKESIIPPEKKIKLDKIDIPDRPGAIKLIPPKPKPMLQESDLFSDALTAAITTKKEPKKRKRRASVSKDNPSSPSTSPSHDQPSTPTTAAPSTSPLGLKNIAPINFYQDTLTEDSANKDENKENDKTENLDDSIVSTDDSKETEIKSPRACTPTEDDPEEIKKLKLDSGLKGVLLHSKKKGPKKCISWKNESDLVDVRYFELDETERVNVTKFVRLGNVNMTWQEISNEGEALQLSRKLGGEDLMEPQIVWRIPFEIDLVDSLTIAYGSKSLEKDIQFAREKSVLQALYFDKRKIPDSPEEPIPENHQMSDPVLIALEDPDGQEIDLKNTPWPEPKGNQPQPEPQIPVGAGMFPNMPVQFNPNFSNIPPPNFPNVPPRFPGPNGPMGVPNFIPPNMIPNGNIMIPPNVMPPNEMLMNQMNPNMFPGGGGGPMSDSFGPEPEFNMFNGPNMNMFPPNNFNPRHDRRGGGGFRPRGRGGNDGGGNWIRMSEPGRGNWRSGNRGGRGRLCKNVQNRGFCRNRDTCPFIHP